MNVFKVKQSVQRREDDTQCFDIFISIYDANGEELQQWYTGQRGKLAQVTYKILADVAEELDFLGADGAQIESDVPFVAQELKDANEGKAVGAACHNALRAFEHYNLTISC